MRRAVELGVCKVNVNAEIRQGYLTRLADRLPAALDGLRLLELEAAVVDAVGEVVTAKLELLEGIPSPSTTAVAGRHSFPDRAD